MGRLDLAVNEVLGFRFVERRTALSLQRPRGPPELSAISLHRLGCIGTMWSLVPCLVRQARDRAGKNMPQLIACAACLTQISSDALACPKCGHPKHPMSTGTAIALPLVFAGVIAYTVFNVGQCAHGPTDAQKRNSGSLPPFPTRVPSGTWATLPKPGAAAPDTIENRKLYFDSVRYNVPGEPPMDQDRAQRLASRLTTELARFSGISEDSISTELQGAIAIRIANGTVGGVLTRGTPMTVAVCSETFLAGSFLAAGLTYEEMASAGVRAIVCQSDDCSGAIDMRPTQPIPLGGIYWGKLCLSGEEFGKLLQLELRPP
jgi:hypothetical protein